MSLALYAGLLAGPVRVVGIEFDLNTLFYAQAGIVVGFMAVSLGLMVRAFGVREGLLPGHIVADYIRRSPLMEVGGVIGIVLVALGLFLGVDLLSQWGGRDLSVGERGYFLRMVSVSSLLMTLGGVALLSSLVMGFLALPLRRTR